MIYILKSIRHEKTVFIFLHRAARPGLYYEGKTGEALFEYALMRNQQ